MAILLVGILAVSPGVGSKHEEKLNEPLSLEHYLVDNLGDTLAYIDDVSRIQAEIDRLAAEEEYKRNLIPVDWARWQRLHICEQRDTWYANGGNPNDPAHQTFQGGLGMSTGAWRMAVNAAANRGVILPVSALSATPEEQMIGAQAFYDAYGWGWECRV